MKTNGGRSRDEILAEVESVRSHMDSTLSQIEHKLTPGQLVDQGLEYLRGSGANEFLSNLGTSVKQNPIPIALTGICLAWLMTAGRTGSVSMRAERAGGNFRRSTDQAWSNARDQARRAGQTLSDAAEAARERFGQARDSVSGTAQSAYERFDQARQSVSSTVQSARESVSGTVQSAREAVSGTVQSARDALSRGADVAQRQLERARGGYDWMMQEQPLALAAIGVAIGAVLGAAAPRTRTEDEWMGEASDRLTERAKEAGREQVERAGDALRSATSSSQEESGTEQQGTKPLGAMQSDSVSGTSGVARDESKGEWPSGGAPTNG